jgi:hypothetical protein
MKQILALYIVTLSFLGFSQYKIESFDNEGRLTDSTTGDSTFTFYIVYDQKFNSYYFGINSIDYKEYSPIINIYKPTFEVDFKESKPIYFDIAFRYPSSYFKVSIFDNPYDDENFFVYLTNILTKKETKYSGNLKLVFVNCP